MAHGSQLSFLVDSYNTLSIPSDVPKNSNFFAVMTTVGGLPMEVAFKWVGRPKNPFYLVDFFDEGSGRRIHRITAPRIDQIYRVENFFPEPTFNPDAEIFVDAAEPDKREPTPGSLAAGKHTLTIARGRVVVR